MTTGIAIREAKQIMSPGSPLRLKWIAIVLNATWSIVLPFQI